MALDVTEKVLARARAEIENASYAIASLVEEVRAYDNDSVSRLLLAEVSIRPDGKLGPVRLHHTKILDNRHKY